MSCRSCSRVAGSRARIPRPAWKRCISRLSMPCRALPLRGRAACGRILYGNIGGVNRLFFSIHLHRSRRQSRGALEKSPAASTAPIRGFADSPAYARAAGLSLASLSDIRLSRPSGSIGCWIRNLIRDAPPGCSFCLCLRGFEGCGLV